MSCKYWNTPNKANVNQGNNSVESLLSAVMREEVNKPVYYETCGPSSLESLLEGLGIDQSHTLPLQPSDWYTMWLNDPARKFPAEWIKPKNRYLESYPRLINDLYPDVSAEVIYWPQSIRERTMILKQVLVAPNSVAMILLENPRHYVAALHLSADGVLVYNDSWLNNPWNRANTHKRSISLQEMVENLRYGMLKLTLQK